MTGFDPLALGERAQAMIDQLAAISEEPDRLTRHYLTVEHRRAVELVKGWMEAAGLTAEVNNTGTLCGLLPASYDGPLSKRRLAIGSHIDTVVDAGRYDGTFGVVAAILAVEELRVRGESLPFELELFAFGDEEGGRFPKTLIGSSAVAGVLDPSVLDFTDGNGVSVRQALVDFGLDPDRISADGRTRGQMLGYLEVHIEQGPVLDSTNKPLGVVTSIAGQSRFAIQIRGEAGHAGTVPMVMRHDALAAAAELMLEAEKIARRGAARGLVATFGQVAVGPGAVNVIPGEARLTLDLRAGDDEARQGAIFMIRRLCREIGARRGVIIGMEAVHETPVVTSAKWIEEAMARSIERLTGAAPLRLMSGAGHDGQAMAKLTEIGMIFVRCRAGISHSPLEFVALEDLGLAVEALVRTIGEIARERAVR